MDFFYISERCRKINNKQIDRNKKNNKCVVSSFKLYKSLGPDSIYPVPLQKEPQSIYQKLCVIFRASFDTYSYSENWENQLRFSKGLVGTNQSCHLY